MSEAVIGLVNYTQTKSCREAGVEAGQSADLGQEDPGVEEDDGRWLSEDDPIERLLEVARNVKPAKPKRGKHR